MAPPAALLIATGIEQRAFLDDLPNVFQPDPLSWLTVRPGQEPRAVDDPADEAAAA